MYTVYKHLDEDENILYIGKSKSLLYRQRQHKKNAEWFEEVDSIEYCTLSSKSEMDLVEIYLINTLNPKYNKKDSRNDDFTSLKLDELNWLQFDMCEIEPIEYSNYNKKELVNLNNSIILKKDENLLIKNCSNINKFQFNVINYCIFYMQNNYSEDLVYEIDILKAKNFIYYTKSNNGFFKDYAKIKTYIETINYEHFEYIKYDKELGIITVKSKINLNNILGKNIDIFNDKDFNECESVSMGSLNLYEYLKLGKSYFTLNEIKDVCGVTGKYPEFKGLKNKVFKKIQIDFLKFYNIELEIEVDKFRSDVRGVEFKIKHIQQ